MSSNNNMFVGNCESVVRNAAENYFRSNNVDYFMECLGYEVLGEVNMGGDTMACVDGEFSADQGKHFHRYRFQHCTGSALMGTPVSVLSQHTLRCGRDEPRCTSDPAGTGTRRVPTRGRSSERSRRAPGCWGYSVYSKFINLIDTDCDPPVIMTPKSPKNMQRVNQPVV